MNNYNDNSWQIFNDDMFERGVNTLLFHNIGIYGYYGKFVMESIKLAITKEQRNVGNIKLSDFTNQQGGRVAQEIHAQLNISNEEITPSSIKNIILKNINEPYEKLRCELYKAGIIKKSIDYNAIDKFEQVFNKTYEKIKSKINNENISKIHWFEDNFDVLDKDELNEYRKACKLIYDRCPDECVLIYILIYPVPMSKTYKIYLISIKHFTRAKPLNDKEWTDNYGLNNYGYSSSLSESKNDLNKDSKLIYTIETVPFEMNNKIIFDIDDCIVNLVMPVKIIDALLHFDNNSNDLFAMFSSGNNEKKWMLLDYIAQKYPNYYAGTHGCNCFKINKSIRYDTLVKFLLRYPTCQIGCILNTSRYGEAGEHWVAITIRNAMYNYINNQYEKNVFMNPYFKVYFCCSFGSNINILHQDIVSDIEEIYNNLTVEVLSSGTKIQKDNYNCGVYSLLFIYLLFMYPGRLDKIREIKENANNIKLKSIENLRIALIGSNSISINTDNINDINLDDNVNEAILQNI